MKPNFRIEKIDSPKGLVPLMAMIQHNKENVRPVIDYRQLNMSTHLQRMLTSAWSS